MHISSGRVESRVTAVSWIPSEAVTGATKAAFATVAHYDDPLPDEIAGERHRRAGRHARRLA